MAMKLVVRLRLWLVLGRNKQPLSKICSFHGPLSALTNFLSLVKQIDDYYNPR